MDDDFERLRRRRDAARDESSSRADGDSPAFVGQVISTGGNLGVFKFLVVIPVDVTGPETEGGLGTVTVIDPNRRVKVLNLGPGIPAPGENVVCRFVDYRWVCQRKSRTGGTGGTGTIPFCVCGSIPSTLTMVSADPLCNFSMFQSCTLQFGPTPPQYAPLNLPANIFLSVQQFPDPVAEGSLFRYALTCQGNQIRLTRVYEDSPFGSPFEDAVLYTWSIGAARNTCNPFRLEDGIAYQGSDASCSVTIEG